MGWFFWVGFGVVFNGLIVGVVSGTAGIAPARNAKRGGPGRTEGNGEECRRHAAAQNATSGRQGPAWCGMIIAWIVVDDTCVGRLLVVCRFCNFDRRNT